MPPTPAADDVHEHLVLGQAGDLVLERLDRAGHVALDDERQLGGLVLLGAAEDVLEGHLAPGAAGQRLGLLARLALLGQPARLAVVGDDADELAGVGDAVEAEDLDRIARQRLGDPLAAEVDHRPHAARLGAGDERRRRPAACRAG